MNIQHSSSTDSWGTPPELIESVRKVLNGIDLDPASSVEFNKVVRANRVITVHEYALVTPWEVENKSVFLNPPGGKTGNKSNTVLFWQKLLSYRSMFSHAIFMGFSLECLQTTQQCPESLLDFPFCVPSKRIRFIAENGLTGPAPSHSNAIAYIPGRVNVEVEFYKEFEKYGKTR